MVQVTHLKLLRIRLWGYTIGLLVPLVMRIKEPKPFKPIEVEQAFVGSCTNYRVNGRPKIYVDTFFKRIRKELIGLIKRELKSRTSARIQTTAWLRFSRDDEEGQERVELAFNSLMMSVIEEASQIR